MDASAALVKVLREEGPRVLAALVRQLGDLPVAEDALSEATIAALGAWPGSGIPDNPRAWLTVVARRKALDLLRRESTRTDKETAAFRWGTERAKDEMEEVIDAMETESQLRDDMLRLIFTCCHPALSREAQVALALRTLARLEVDAIARAFLVPEATMATRLVRARSKIATAHIPHAIPSDAELPDRLAAVLAVVYLIATEAHAPTGGNAVARVDLEAEASVWPLVGGVDARRARGAVFAGSVVHLSSHSGAKRRPRPRRVPRRSGPWSMEPGGDCGGIAVVV